MKETESHQNAVQRFLPGNPLWLLGAGLALLLAYLAVATALGYFIDPDLNYKSVYNLQPLGKISAYHDRDFSKYHLLSVIWKMTLLFPATVCLTLFAAMKLPVRQVGRMLGSLKGMHPKHQLTATCLGLLVLMVLVANVLLQRQPLYDDERAYEFQAQVFRSGRLYAEEPPGTTCFNQNPFIIVKDGKWLGKYSPGHSAILAVGLFTGSPYILPLLMAAAIPLLVYFIARDRYGTGTAILAGGLFLISPAFLFTSGTLMNHATELFFLALFTFAYFRSAPGRSWLYPVLAGLALGCAFNIRPQDAVAYGGAFGVLSLVQMIRHRRAGVVLRQVLILAAFGVLFALFLLYNEAVTGSYLKTPFHYYSPEWHFGLQAGEKHSWAHDLHVSIVHMLLNVSRMNLWLFGWPFSLLFILLFFMRGDPEKSDRVFLGVIIIHIIIYLLFSSRGVEELGARYYFSLLLPLMLFTAREMIALHRYLKASMPGPRMHGEAMVPVFVCLSFLFALGTFYVEKSVHFRDLARQVAAPYRAVEQAGIQNAIVQIHSLPPSGWVFGYRNCKPDLSDDVIYVWMGEPEDTLEIMDRMKGRAFYRMAYDAAGKRILLGRFSRESIEEELRAKQASQISPDRGEPPVE